eukprot:TRINITY_DN74384_c0_g1_i1.p1 TRINITY_DN74384_c0_g1~~TRINITY_DN74384_c0_g1_i1.p1  ORF type:complete len:524 (+),score=89.47 TRINITY_DN74384_c0_g1_i1:223-1572(+)
MTSCVSAPPKDTVPKEPETSLDDTAWPDQWSADITAWTYPGWEHDASESKGKFYYDKRYGSKLVYTKLRGKPSSTVEAWNANVNGVDKLFFNTGKLCLGFPITDPGIKGKPKVGIEQPDWIKRCNQAGFATFVARELVTVDGKEEWADHYSCRILYEAVNQSIVFQNWHSLGLGAVPKGLPLRVTGGNSKPDPQQSPRINSVWHSNFTVGSSSSTPDDFQWKTRCIGPVCFGCKTSSAQEAEEFFGHKVRSEHLSSVDFISRARFLPLASADKNDLRRAAQRKPGPFFQGSSFQETMRKLNDALTREANLTTKQCSDFSLKELHEVQQLLFDARSPQLDHIYKQAKDTRSMAHGSLAELAAEQSMHRRLGEGSILGAKAKAGLCHELVMWYVHHLSAPARQEVKKQVVLPLLPEVQHTSSGEHKVHQRYNEQVSCAICHVAPASDIITV